MFHHSAFIQLGSKGFWNHWNAYQLTPGSLFTPQYQSGDLKGVPILLTPRILKYREPLHLLIQLYRPYQKSVIRTWRLFTADLIPPLKKILDSNETSSKCIINKTKQKNKLGHALLIWFNIYTIFAFE